MTSHWGWRHSRTGSKGIWRLCRCYKGLGVLNLDLRMAAYSRDTLSR